MILCVARRGGQAGVLRMVAALCRDNERKQYEALLAAPPVSSAILAIAAQRPLDKDEVAEYLRYKRQFRAGSAPVCTPAYVLGVVTNTISKVFTK